jgi:hypothetical protein
MRSFYSLLTYRKPCLKCGRVKKLHAPVGVPPSGLLTSLRLLVQCLPPATTRRTGGREKGKEGRRKREGEGKGEKGKEGRKREGEGKGVESDKKCKFNKIGSNSTFLDANGDF